MWKDVVNLFGGGRAKNTEPDRALVTEYAPDQCGNCHSFLKEGDLYCRVCGTRRGEGKFEPYENIMQCIYGPQPIERTHVCKNCGYTWKTVLMIDKEKYCPRCGNAVPLSRRNYL